MRFFNKAVAKTLPIVPKGVVKVFAARYFAGETLTRAVHKCKQLEKMGAMATLDYLGESVTDKEIANNNLQMYLKILDAIKTHNLDSNISIKPTSFGAVIDKEFCYECIEKLVAKAHEINNFLRIDMEDHPYTDFTVDSYHKLRQKYPGSVGTVLQSYMKRTFDDASNLCDTGQTNLRLCKGIYKEPAEIAYHDGKMVNNNFVKTLEHLFSKSAYVGIATHDDWLVKEAIRLVEKYKLKKDQYEFQMLLGVRPELRDEILKAGYRLRIYIPFGEEWHAYSVRRFNENPDILGNFIKGMLSFKS